MYEGHRVHEVGQEDYGAADPAEPRKSVVEGVVPGLVCRDLRGGRGDLRLVLVHLPHQLQPLPAQQSAAVRLAGRGQAKQNIKAVF